MRVHINYQLHQISSQRKRERERGKQISIQPHFQNWLLIPHFSNFFVIGDPHQSTIQLVSRLHYSVWNAKDIKPRIIIIATKR